MATVTIGVPVYRGGPFLGEALESIRRQTFGDFEALISMDGGPDPDSEAACRPYLEDPRFRLVVQPERLGWVGNINWLMAQVHTPYWYYHQQDDLVDPTYVQVLVEHAEQWPEAAVVYCDMQSFGAMEGGFTQADVTGPPAARMLALLREHFPAVAFRGLTRRGALGPGRLRANDIENFAADSTWMAGVVRCGELRRVPQVLYRKRFHSDNVHTKWRDWPVEKRKRAWITHCRDMLEHALEVPASRAARRSLWLATAERVLNRSVSGPYLPRVMPRPERLEVLNAFLDLVPGPQVSTWLEEDWTRLRERTLAKVCPPDPHRVVSWVRHRLAPLKRRLRGK